MLSSVLYFRCVFLQTKRASKSKKSSFGAEKPAATSAAADDVGVVYASIVPAAVDADEHPVDNVYEMPKQQVIYATLDGPQTNNS